MGGLIKSFAYAFNGLRSALKTERNLRIHIVAMCLAVILGLYLGLTTIEWGLIIFAIGFVFFAELINTAIERLGDEAANGQYKKAVKNAKDTAAAAVMLSALIALIIGILVLFIPLVNKLSNL